MNINILNGNVKNILDVVCESCGQSLTLTYEAPKVSELQVGESITFNGPKCPCGGALSAPGGHYIRDEETGILNRIGDYQASN